MSFTLQSPVLLLSYDDQFREYVLRESGDSSAQMVFRFCPFCGIELPTSVREPWFDYFWSRDLDPREDEVPVPMRSGQWWRDAGL